MLGSLTVLPALLSRLGDNVDRLRMPFVSRLRRDDGEGRIWGSIVDRVLRRPLLSAVLAGGVLVALALPALQLHMATLGPETLPQLAARREGVQPDAEGISRQGDRRQRRRQGRERERADSSQAAIAELEQRALASGRQHEPITVDVNKDATVANITVPIDGKGADARLERCRRQPARDGRAARRWARSRASSRASPAGQPSGRTATTRSKSKLPLVFAFVLLFAFALMLVAFRSIVIAVKAIVLNLLSVAAAYGVLVLVFQHGFGKRAARVRAPTAGSTRSSRCSCS